VDKLQSPRVNDNQKRNRINYFITVIRLLNH
jgi:hypothetical protein